MLPNFTELFNRFRSDEEKQRKLRDAMINVTAFAVSVGAILLARNYFSDDDKL